MKDKRKKVWFIQVWFIKFYCITVINVEISINKIKTSKFSKQVDGGVISLLSIKSTIVLVLRLVR